MSEVTDQAALENMLRNIFNGGTMDRLPRNRRNSEAFLALAAASLDSQGELSETEVNTQLTSWMEGFTNSTLFDHVTVRRYLVDLSMLLRDSEGSRYRTNQSVISSFITLEARAVQPKVILEEVQLMRMQRQRAAGVASK